MKMAATCTDVFPAVDDGPTFAAAGGRFAELRVSSAASQRIGDALARNERVLSINKLSYHAMMGTRPAKLSRKTVTPQLSGTFLLGVLTFGGCIEQLGLHILRVRLSGVLPHV